MYKSDNLKQTDNETFIYIIDKHKDFKILQLTDLHLGFGFISRKKDKLALNAVTKIIHKAKPDMIVLTGDSIFPFLPKAGTLNNRKQAYKLMKFMDSFAIPYTLVFGNHDCEMGSTCNKEELAQIYDGVVYNDKLRICFDTCHTSDSGYDIIHHFDDVIDEFDRLIGKDQIAVFHINDSKNIPGAAKDRHANIGFGHIGFDAIHHIVHHKDFMDIPKILETPYIPSAVKEKKSYAPYKYEIRMLKEGIFHPELPAEILAANEK